MTCFICKRAPIPHLSYKRQPLCAHCAPNALAGEMMLQFSETEEEAIAKGGELAGEYLDHLGKTDMGELSAEQWAMFLHCVLEGYSEHMRAEAKKYPPF